MHSCSKQTHGYSQLSTSTRKWEVLEGGMESSGPSGSAEARSVGLTSLPRGAGRLLRAGLEYHHLETPFSTVLGYSMVKIKLNLPMTPIQPECLQKKDKH